MGVLELLLPPACAGCSRYGAVLCAACISGMRPARRPADRFAAADPGIVIGEALDLAVAAFVHEGSLRRALQRLKYGGAAKLAVPLASSAASAFAELVGLVDGEVVLVPIPVHPERLRQRGYNQAALIAHELGTRAGIEVHDVLQRTRPTLRQHGLSRAARLQNLRGAFGLGAPPPQTGTVLLVDDILTTAATLEACAEVLHAGGTPRVLGFAIAREV